MDAPTPQHVDRWLSQFTPENQLPFLREFAHVIGQTFITKEAVIRFLDGLLVNQELSGSNPSQYWGAANVLQVQRNGRSQQEMVGLLRASLEQRYGIDASQCGSMTGDYIYLDDVIFSGSRAITDLSVWIRECAPATATLHIIVIAFHMSGYYWSRDKLLAIIGETGKNITIKYWRSAKVENRKAYKNNSNVLWPVVAPDSSEVQAYVAALAVTRYPMEFRVAGSACWPFSSEDGREILETEFFIAGAKIKAGMAEEKNYFRPLGFGSFGAGFGTLIVTYRNCPNNAPLALWWGNGGMTTPALNWYPLLKRRTYWSLENIFDDFA
ncbi:phosphoribosyltransferase-like protein [Solilutibacter silvestris]|uniref:phosphoribosyltransferase-like protein n=1 Tax=Solilutibacter silvestris TaxID=1645665 RepID=UPI003D343A00